MLHPGAVLAGGAGGSPRACAPALCGCAAGPLGPGPFTPRSAPLDED